MHLVHTLREWKTNAVERARAFAHDVRRLWNASSLVASAVAASGLFRGLGVALALQHIGNFIDAAIGARGIGTVTSEFRVDLWQMLLVLLLVVVAHVFTRRLSGLSLSIADRISNVLLPLSLLVLAFSMLESNLSFLLVLWAVRACVRNPWIVAALSAAIAVLALVMIQDVLVFTATRTITVGTMLTIGGAGLYLGLWWAAQPYRTKLQ